MSGRKKRTSAFLKKRNGVRLHVLIWKWVSADIKLSLYNICVRTRVVCVFACMCVCVCVCVCVWRVWLNWDFGDRCYTLFHEASSTTLLQSVFGHRQWNLMFSLEGSVWHIYGLCIIIMAVFFLKFISQIETSLVQYLPKQTKNFNHCFNSEKSVLNLHVSVTLLLDVWISQNNNRLWTWNCLLMGVIQAGYRKELFYMHQSHTT